jgi:hypothetical protein
VSRWRVLYERNSRADRIDGLVLGPDVEDCDDTI